jgi:hypothetical protein
MPAMNTLKIAVCNIHKGFPQYYRRMVRICFRISLFALTLPLMAHASLPKPSNVPGGIAIVSLGSILTGDKPPQAWMGNQPVLVTSDGGQWYAVVGLSLNTKSGSHSLRTKVGDESITKSFEVNPKDYPEQHISIKDKGKVELSAADAVRAKREIKIIKRLKRHWRNAHDTDPVFILPAEGRLASRFGLRRFFNGEPRSPHAGLDVALPVGTPVKASSHGVVLAVGNYFFNGKTVFLDHGSGLITMYSHLERIDVKRGKAVIKGQPLGLSGKTGRSTGPHLHWSVILNGEMVDPELFVAEDRVLSAD